MPYAGARPALVPAPVPCWCNLLEQRNLLNRAPSNKAPTGAQAMPGVNSNCGTQQKASRCLDNATAGCITAPMADQAHNVYQHPSTAMHRSMDHPQPTTQHSSTQLARLTCQLCFTCADHVSYTHCSTRQNQKQIQLVRTTRHTLHSVAGRQQRPSNTC